MVTMVVVMVIVVFEKLTIKINNLGIGLSIAKAFNEEIMNNH